MADQEIRRVFNTRAFTEAIVKINKRAERQQDLDKLVEVFVQTDLPTRCESNDHQVILGRRGTGKTHLIRFFQANELRAGGFVHYCDCTRLGSGLPSASKEPANLACKYFSALLNDIGTALLDWAILLETPPPGLQDKVLAKLADGLVRYLAPNSPEALSLFNYRQM